MLCGEHCTFDRHFDVYKTVRVLSRESGRIQGASLLNPLRADRTCKEVGIPSQHCPCAHWKSIEPNEGAVAQNVGLKIASLMATKLNDEVRSAGALASQSCLKWLPGSGYSSSSAITQGKFIENSIIATVNLHTSKFNTLGNQQFSVKLEVKTGIKKRPLLKLTTVQDVSRALGKGALEISHWFQVSKWGRYEKCAPEGVPLNICACE